jgi:hypothetical protein
VTDKDPPKTPDLLDWLSIRKPPDWARARWVGAGVSVFLFLLFTLAIAALFLELFRTVRQGMSPAGTGPNLGTGALIAAVLGAPFVIWATWLKHRTVTFQKEGHITDRINKAVEMLGAEKIVKEYSFDPQGNTVQVERTTPNIEVRIGAILSLERIAQDSTAYDHGRDHVRVMEILCAYVRENAPVKINLKEDASFKDKTPRTDIQVAMDVIKRRTPSQLQIESKVRYRLDLRRVDLDGADLSKGNLSAAQMWESRFEAADFFETDLTGTQFIGANLNYATFLNSRMRGTILNQATLNKVRFSGLILAEIHGVMVEAADISGVRILLEDADDFFGSRDTIPHPSQESLSEQALDLADKIRLDNVVKDGRTLAPHTPEISKELRQFLHWNPYGLGDHSSAKFREPYRIRKGLKGWPFEG